MKKKKLGKPGNWGLKGSWIDGLEYDWTESGDVCQDANLASQIPLDSAKVCSRP